MQLTHSKRAIATRFRSLVYLIGHFNTKEVDTFANKWKLNNRLTQHVVSFKFYLGDYGNIYEKLIFDHAT